MTKLFVGDGGEGGLPVVTEDASRYHGPRLLVGRDVGDDPTALYHHMEDLPYVLVEDTGHWLHLDRPRVFNALLDRFLERVERETPAT